MLIALLVTLTLTQSPTTQKAPTTVVVGDVELPRLLERNAPVPSCVPAGAPNPSLFTTLHPSSAEATEAPTPPGVSDSEARKAVKKLASSKAALREEGMRMVRTFVAPEGQWALYSASRASDGPTRLAVLEHLKALGAQGQAGLTWIAIHDRDPAIRNEAVERIDRPIGPEALGVIDGALRSTNHMVVNQAGLIAGQINAVQAIPLLIAAQFAQDPVGQRSDLAWISIGTQRSYVANLIPITGNSAAGFQPVIGQILEGVVMAIDDIAEMATTYRPSVHQSLLAMSTHEWGKSTEHLGWNMNAWVEWYNTEFMPHMIRRGQDQAAATPR